MKQVLSFIVLFVALHCKASCPSHEFTPASKISIHGDSVLVVVHASSSFDARFSSKRGVDEAVRFAKSRHIPVLYLQDDSPDQFYYMEDCSPDYWVYSQGGEINIDLSGPSHLYIVGGHLELCMATTLNAIIEQWSQNQTRNRKVTYFMDAIYSNGKMIDSTDPFYHDFDRFMEVVAYGRPGGEHWPKLSLLETMGVILDEEHEMDYITQILPRWDRTVPDTYQVEVTLDQSRKKVLRTAPGWNPPLFSFHFVDSAINLQFPNCSLGSYGGECAP